MGSRGNEMGALRKIIKLLLLVVSLGYLMVWAMMPTNNFFLGWEPTIQSATDSTFFEKQGGNTLIYVFPILFIAFMSSIYLHLGRNSGDNSNRKGSGFAPWKRPAIVKGPLGIVSWTELSFLTMIMGLLVWSMYSYLHDMFAHIRQEASSEGLQVWVAKLEWTGLTMGLLGNICLGLMFFPVTRGSSILGLMGLTSEASIKYHMWLGHSAMALFTAHGLLYVIFWAKTDQISQMVEWANSDVAIVAGEIALLCGLVMWVTSLKPIRRKVFELFFYTHHLYIGFVAFYVFHVGFPESCTVLAGFYLFLVDRCLRLLQSQQRIRLVSARILTCETLELNFSKSPALSYSPTSILFLNVPSISKLQWHPFSITSSSNMDPDKLSVVIKSEGSWSRELYQMLSSPSPVNHLRVAIEGPYGPASTNLMRHDLLVMVSGGSGITPFISIIREVIFAANATGGRPPRVLLICAFKKYEYLSILDLILPASGTAIDYSRLDLQVHAYVTRDREPKAESLKPPRTLWLEPETSDIPISPILGQNNWLWLAAIISASFVMYLLLIGILTRYYIYPVDHDSETAYSFASRSALNMLFICVAITVTASGAFIWNKRRSAKEMMQVRSTDTPKPPSSHYDFETRELESLPRQSILESAKVHFGERPNLKKLLSECREASVRVLVSGPRKMRQEVAAVCSSASADNLHFESISFSW